MCMPLTHNSPSIKTQKVSTRLALPARIDFISVPVRTIPATYVSKIS